MACCEASAPPAVPVPTADSTCPEASTTATSVVFIFGIPAETRWTIACTWSVVSVTPGRVRTNTDAVGSACWLTKTLSCGSASLTVAASTPSIDSTVLPSSPSVARW